MSEALSAIQAAGAGAVLDIVKRMRNIATEFELVENTDSTEYKDGLLRELKGFAEVLDAMGIKANDIFVDSSTVPFEIVQQVLP